MFIIDILCGIKGQGSKILLLAGAQKDFLGIPGRFPLYRNGPIFFNLSFGCCI